MLLETFIMKELINKNIEKFSDAAAAGWTIIIVYLLLVFIYSYGASKLSWAYNTYNGIDFGYKLLYSILAFIFSGIYYPMYAFFLNPLGLLRRNSYNPVRNVSTSQRLALNKVV